MPRPEIEALSALIQTAEDNGIRVLVIGAYAREHIVDAVYQGQRYRATRDVDTSIRVESWSAYYDLIQQLQTDGGFRKIGDYTLKFKNGVEMDILPFGGVADENGNLTWENADRVLSLAGLDAVSRHSTQVTVDGLTFSVPTVEGYIGIKLFAFRDRGDRGSPDLGDLTYTLSGASDSLIPIEQLYAEIPAGDVERYDFDQLGPLLLGRRLASIVPLQEAEDLIKIVETLILDDPDYRALTLLGQFGDIQRRIAWFEALRDGIRATR